MTTAVDAPLLDCARAYAAAGIAVFPVRVQIVDGRKKVTPITAWDKQSTTDPETISIWFGPRGVWRDASIGIDCGKSNLVVVDQDGAEGIANWGALVTEHRIAATWRAATPGDGQHWYFRADPHQPLGNSTSKIAPRVDVRGVGGFVIAPPSTDTRGAYRWLEGEPEWSQLPVVPHLVIDRQTAKRVITPKTRNGQSHTNGHRRFTHDQAIAFCRPHIEALRAAEDGTINDTLNKTAMILGHFVPHFWTERAAVKVLHDALSATMYDGRTWQADNTITSGLTAGVADWTAEKVEPDTNPSHRRPPPTNDDQPEPSQDKTTGPTDIPALPGLPDAFWDSRTVLAHIRQAAWARVQSPDVVFHAVLTRLSALMDHRIKADSGISRPASLNHFAGIVGHSGDGKTQGVKVGEELIPAPEPAELDFEGVLPLGSGEGVAEAYQGMKELPPDGKKKPKEIKTQVRHNAMFYVDEGQTFTKLLYERNGSTTGAALRSGWGGDMIGQRNAQEVTTRIVAEGSYCLGLIVAFQPAVVAGLLADGATGMPQRFCWSTATDPNIPDERVAWPGNLPWNPDIIRRPATIQLPDAIKTQLHRDALARKRGQLILDELDGQQPLMMVKLAALLALLDSRTDVTGEDWELAEIVWDTSCAVRDTLLTMAHTQILRERAAKDDMYVARAVKQSTAVTAASHAVERVARQLAARVHESEGGITHGDGWRSLSGRDRRNGGRGLYDAGVEHAAAQQWIKTGEHGMVPGQSRPAEPPK